MKEITIEIAGQKYEVRPLSIKKGRAWREQLGAKFDGLIGAMQGIAIVEATNVAGVGNIIASLRETLITSIDEVLNLVCAYAPAIEADRARIEDEGVDEEIVDAFSKILGLAFPLGAIGRAMNGLTASMTSKN